VDVTANHMAKQLFQPPFGDTLIKLEPHAGVVAIGTGFGVRVVEVPLATRKRCDQTGSIQGVHEWTNP
jgi:hypothetical protein